MALQVAPRLSVCMIAKNEAAIIGRCCASIQSAADEIIVVDTGSDDATVSIVRKFGARVISEPWRNDFSHARNISIRDAKGAWILWLDADDVLPAESIALLEQLKMGPADKVYGMIVRNQKPNGTGTEFLQARMFPNNRGIRFERPIHEQMMPSALRLGLKMAPSSVVIEHHGYALPEELKKKAGRNVLMLLAENKGDKPDPVVCIEIADSFAILEDAANSRIWYEKVVTLPEIEKMSPVIASQAYMGLGNICNKHHEYAMAIDHFTQAEKLCSARTDALYCLAVAYEMDGQKQLAVETLARIFPKKAVAVQVGVDFRQTRIKAYLRTARLLRELNRKGELATLCKAALEELGGRREIQNMAGIAYYYLDRLLDALHCFENSIKILTQGNIDAYTGLYMIYCRAGKKDVAGQTLETMGKLFSSMPKYWALRELSKGTVSEQAVPAEVVREEVERQMEIITMEYALDTAGQ